MKARLSWRLALWLRLLLLAWLSAFALAGCGSGPAADKAVQESNLKPLAVLYGQYSGQNRGQNPPNEEAFKAFVKTKVASPAEAEALFISSRDQKPYVIRYGGTFTPPGPGVPIPVVAYEQEGVGGKRYLATALGGVEEVEEAAFRALVPDAK